MTEDKFTVFEFGYGGEYTISGIDATFKSKRCAEKVCDKLNELLQEKIDKEKLIKENKELKEALLFYLDVTLCDWSSNWDYDMNKWCKILLGCNYKEAKELYGNFKHQQRWELDE